MRRTKTNRQRSTEAYDVWHLAVWLCWPAAAPTIQHNCNIEVFTAGKQQLESSTSQIFKGHRRSDNFQAKSTIQNAPFGQSESSPWIWIQCTKLEVHTQWKQDVKDGSRHPRLRRRTDAKDRRKGFHLLTTTDFCKLPKMTAGATALTRSRHTLQIHGFS